MTRSCAPFPLRLPYLPVALVFAMAFAASLEVPSARADDLPFDLNAGDLQYDVNSGKINASGGVEVSGPDGHLTANSLTYDVSTDLILAQGNVVYVDNQSNTLYLEQLQLTGRMQKGAAERLRLAMPRLGEVLQASRADKVSATSYTMDDVVYSPCKTCQGDRKPWRIRADKMTYDQADQTMSYKNAKLDVLDVPVLYLPYFSHPVGPARPRNGMLMPQFGTSTVMGQQVRLGGYYFDPESNADYTLRTRLMTERGAQLQLERRQVTDHTETQFNGSYLNDTGIGKVRSHMFLMADHVVEPGQRVGITGEIASDDSYLNEFFGRTDPYLGTTVYGEDASDNHYAAFSATRYQDLDPNHDPAETAQVLPHLELEQLVPLGNDGSQLMLNVDSLNLSRGEGARYRRFLTSADYTKPVYLEDGSKLTLGGSMRMDFYNVDSNTAATASNGSDNVMRWLPEATATWEKPYISPNGMHTIAPTVMAAISPRGGNPDEIPNEDSVAYELDESNLFEPSRYAGLDRVETGPRLVYGLDNRWGTAGNTDWRLFLGQGIRRFNDDALPASGGAATTISDWVGYAEANPVDWFNFNQRFRLDNATFDVRRLDTQMRLGRDKETRLYATHTFLDNGPEEVSADFRAPLTDWLEFLSRMRKDMAEDKLLLGEAGFLFKQNCYEVSLIARRHGYETSDLRPGTDYLVNVQLLTLGGDDE